MKLFQLWLMISIILSERTFAFLQTKKIFHSHKAGLKISCWNSLISIKKIICRELSQSKIGLILGFFLKLSSLNGAQSLSISIRYCITIASAPFYKILTHLHIKTAISLLLKAKFLLLEDTYHWSNIFARTFLSLMNTGHN